MNIISEQEQIKSGDDFHFIARCRSEQDVEIVVFTEGHSLFHQNAILTPGDHVFDIKTIDAPAGKYFVLVTGKAIHEEYNFTIGK